MNHASGAVTSLDAEMAQVGDIVGQRARRSGLFQGAVRPVGVIEILVLAKDDHQVPLVPGQRPVQQLLASATPRAQATGSAQAAGCRQAAVIPWLRPKRPWGSYCCLIPVSRAYFCSPPRDSITRSASSTLSML